MRFRCTADRPSHTTYLTTVDTVHRYAAPLSALPTKGYQVVAISSVVRLRTPSRPTRSLFFAVYG